MRRPTGAEAPPPALHHETRVDPWAPAPLLGREIAPGAKLRFGPASHGDFTAAVQDLLVLVTRGARPGPTLCVAAAVHGDEINGGEIARAVFERSDPATLRGMLVALPIVNAHGFRRGDRFLADRRDLNRFFPGSGD